MKTGDRVQVRAYKSDGTCYRWWLATVESINADELVLITPVGHWVEGIDGGWASQYAIRAYYWPHKWYSVLEAYVAGGRLAEIYINISSPAEVEDSIVRFTDYELDISRRLPHAARIVDEDEFLEAVSKYDYSKEFQEACYQVAREAVEVADGWTARANPRF